MRPLRGFAARALDLRSARLPCVSAVALTSAHLYGFEASSQWFKRRTLDPYLLKRSEGITYSLLPPSDGQTVIYHFTETVGDRLYVERKVVGYADC